MLHIAVDIKNGSSNNQRNVDITCKKIETNENILNVDLEAPKRLINIKQNGNNIYPAFEQDKLNYDQYLDLLLKFQKNLISISDGMKLGYHLFETIIGTKNWNTIIDQKEQIIDIDLMWESEDKLFARIPWEIMHDSKRFILRNYRNLVTITRIATQSEHAKVTLSIPPSVLFVIGSNLDDTNVRAGSEYLGLLKWLETKNLVFNSRILLNANLTTLDLEIDKYKPSVIHFVCHGDINANNSAVIQLGQNVIDYQLLLNLIRNHESYYPMIILNCCESTLFAQELINFRIPYAIAMSGSISDSACRNFTRSFYDDILQGKPLHISMSHARFVPSNNKIDWARPVLYRNKNIELEINEKEKEKYCNKCTFAKKYTENWKPKTLCDRNDLIRGYQDLIKDDENCVLLIKQRGSIAQQGKLGRTMALQAMSSLALRDGFIPCFITFKDDLFKNFSINNVMVNRFRIAQNIVQGIRETISNTLKLGEYRLSDTETNKLKLLKINGEESKVLHPKVNELVKYYDTSSDQIDINTLITALRIDLTNMTKYYKKITEKPEKIILIIDDAQKIPEELLSEFLYDWIKEFFSSLDDTIPIKIVMAVNCTSDKISAMVNLFPTQIGPKVDELMLKPFSDPQSDITPYIQFLLSRDRPLIPDTNDTTKAMKIFNILHKYVQGFPSELISEVIEATLLVCEEMGHIKRGNEETILKLVQKFKIPATLHGIY